MNIAITGGTGFAGRHLVDHLSRFPDVKLNVIVIKGEKISYPADSRIRFTESDFSSDDLNRIFSGTDQVIHLAGVRMPRSAEYVPFDYFLEANVRLTENVVMAASTRKVKRVIFASTIAVYGSPVDNLPFTEKDPPAPLNNYGLSKLAGELILNQFRTSHGIEGVILRFPQIFGAGERPDLITGNFISKCRSGEDILITPGGLQKRDYVYIADVVNAFETVVRRENVDGCFNIGSGRACNAYEIALIIRRILGSASGISIPSTIPEEQKIYMDISKAGRELGWKPRWDVAEGVGEMSKPAE